MLAEPLIHALIVRRPRALVQLLLHHVTAHHHGQVLADQVGEVDEGRPGARQAGQHENLRPVVFHVLLNVDELLNAAQRGFVRLSLS